MFNCSIERYQQFEIYAFIAQLHIASVAGDDDVDGNKSKVNLIYTLMFNVDWISHFQEITEAIESIEIRFVVDKIGCESFSIFDSLTMYVVGAGDDDGWWSGRGTGYRWQANMIN